MGLFEQVAGALGGAQQARQQLDRWQEGQADFRDPQSPDLQRWNDLIGAAPAPVVQDALTQAAQQTPAQDYRDHVTPGAGGTDPLGELGRSALPIIASALINAYLNSRRGNAGAGGAGGTGGTGGGLDQLIELIPGLRTTNPSQMSPNDVAILADHVRQNDPNAFGRAATEVGQRDPDLLRALLGNKALMMGAAALAAKLLSDRARANRRAA